MNERQQRVIEACHRLSALSELEIPQPLDTSEGHAGRVYAFWTNYWKGEPHGLLNRHFHICVGVRGGILYRNQRGKWVPARSAALIKKCA